MDMSANYLQAERGVRGTTNRPPRQRRSGNFIQSVEIEYIAPEASLTSRTDSALRQSGSRKTACISQPCQARGGLLPEALFLEAVTDFSVVNAEKFSHSGGHVDVVRLSLGTFLVEELIHRVGLGGVTGAGYS